MNPTELVTLTERLAGSLRTLTRSVQAVRAGEQRPLYAVAAEEDATVARVAGAAALGPRLEG
jgi:hypothetical protein